MRQPPRRDTVYYQKLKAHANQHEKQMQYILYMQYNSLSLWLPELPGAAVAVPELQPFQCMWAASAVIPYRLD